LLFEGSYLSGLSTQRGKNSGHKNFLTRNVRNNRPTKQCLKKHPDEKSDRNIQRNMSDIKTPRDLTSMFSNSGKVALLLYIL